MEGAASIPRPGFGSTRTILPRHVRYQPPGDRLGDRTGSSDGRDPESEHGEDRREADVLDQRSGPVRLRSQASTIAARSLPVTRRSVTTLQHLQERRAPWRASLSDRGRRRPQPIPTPVRGCGRGLAAPSATPDRTRNRTSCAALKDALTRVLASRRLDVGGHYAQDRAACADVNDIHGCGQLCSCCPSRLARGP